MSASIGKLMIAFGIRLCGRLFLLILIVISLVRLGYSHKTQAEIERFFTISSACSHMPCFIGVVPDETEQPDVYALLIRSPLIADFQVRQPEFGLRQMFISWSADSPSFMVDDGLITLIGGRAETIELDPYLLLGDLIVALGQPDETTLSSFNMYFYYADTGIIVESAINCRAIWYSPVRVIYRQRQSFNTMAETNATIDDFCP